MRVLISDVLEDVGVKKFQEAPGIEVDVKPGLAPEELKKIIGEYDGLVIRSATKVTEDLLSAATRLKVVGRAVLPAIGAVLVAHSTAAAAAADPSSIFHIDRNKNRNQVHYGVRVDAGCRPVGAEPVYNYWLRLEEDPPVDRLVHSWREYHRRLMRWQHRIGKPILITEVGYLSQRGAAARPWNEGADEALDLDLQRRCYEAFRRVWDGEERLAGAYFWNWFGWGGPTSKEYTPRAKPAAREVAAWYKHAR